jgi:hypothetical protein
MKMFSELSCLGVVVGGGVPGRGFRENAGWAGRRSSGETGGKIALGALESGGKFVSRNAGRFVSILGDLGTFAEAGLALQVGGTVCVAGAVGASVTAPFAAPFAWFGCGSFIFGNVTMMGWAAYNIYKTAHHIH